MHVQNGANTKRRNLRHLFIWLEAEYDHPRPYTDQLNRYGAVKVKPSTLSLEFIKDLLEVAGDGKGRSFEDARDYALIRMLCEGLRRTEIAQMRLEDLPELLGGPAQALSVPAKHFDGVGFQPHLEPTRGLGQSPSGTVPGR